MNSQTTLQDLLQAEFSPLLDTSLIAAIVADHVSDGHINVSGILPQTLQGIRTVLCELAAEAERGLSNEDALLGFSQFDIAPNSITDETTSSYDFFSPGGSSSTAGSSSDTSSNRSFSSPLGFLQAVFPNVQTSKLKSALDGFGGDTEDIDMAAVVEGLLTSEYLRELEERGLCGLDGAEIPQYEAPWQIVEGKKKAPWKSTKKRATTITLVDVRQKQHARTASMSTRVAPPDPWTQLSSVSSYLASLLPTHPESYFHSIFNSPNHPTPAKALRAALASISNASLWSSGSDELTSEETSLLFGMFEVLTSSPLYAELNVEERDQLISDAQLALRSTRNHPDSALDLVWLLRDLDSDFATGELARGVYHQPVPASPIASARRLKCTTKLPAAPPSTLPPPLRSHSLPQSPQFPIRTPTNAWKTVPSKPTPKGPHPLADYIPAYSSAPGTRKVRGSGNVLGKYGKGDVGELHGKKQVEGHRRLAWELMERRRAALRQAGRAWKRGHAKNRGGDVAFYFAEKARELQAQARQEQMIAARERVQATRRVSANTVMIDLHGLVVAEAIQVVKDVLLEDGASSDKPLNIITGKGTHSVGGVGVLGPAVKSALEDDGWMVTTLNGGLLVRGRCA